MCRRAVSSVDQNRRSIIYEAFTEGLKATWFIPSSSKFVEEMLWQPVVWKNKVLLDLLSWFAAGCVFQDIINMYVSSWPFLCVVHSAPLTLDGKTSNNGCFWIQSEHKHKYNGVLHSFDTDFDDMDVSVLVG